MGYSYLNGVPIIFGILILALPLFSKSITYRSATIFAAANAIIVTVVFFVSILRARSRFIDGEAIAYYLALSLPSLYIASLIVGLTVVQKGAKPSTVYVGAAIAIIGSAPLVVYFTPLILKLIGTLMFGSHRTGLRYYLVTEVNRFTLPPLITLTVSTFIAATATVIIMRRLQRSA
jgi:hypothetical protein